MKIKILKLVAGAAVAAAAMTNTNDAKAEGAGAEKDVRAWQEMSPYDIVDTFYRPGQSANRMKTMPPRDSQPWMKMTTKDFLPCIDKYGQFKWRDWLGKTKSDADLVAARDEEAKDLAAHPGPDDRTKFGGWAKGPRLAATGRFRTHLDAKGKWWKFRDPWDWDPSFTKGVTEALAAHYRAYSRELGRNTLKALVRSLMNEE